MIVKNEIARIERCLVSVAPHICCWAILDTGSDDGTPQAIRDFFGARSIPGVMGEAIFTDFSTTRNLGLNLGRQLDLAFDYFLLVDADMELVGEPGFQEAPSGAPRGAAAYQMMQRGNSLTYWNTRLLKRGVRAAYRGVTHEYLDIDGPIGKWEEGWFLDYMDGANRPGKFERDIELLTKGLQDEPNNARYEFYLAQSYQDAGRFEEAIPHYQRRVEMGDWDEERWCAQLRMSRCLRALNR